MKSNIHAIVMAAGKGTRMKSRLPKVLQRLANKPLLAHLLQTLQQLKPQTTVVITGHEQHQVENFVTDFNAQIQLPKLAFALQQPQLGTAHAVMQATPHIPDDGIALILSGDVPLIKADTLSALVQQANSEQMSLLTIELYNPTGYGRILRNAEQQIMAIVEEKDATAQQRLIKEVNTGIMAIPSRWLKQNLAKIDNNNQQNEYYLTDIIQLAVTDNIAVKAVICTSEAQVSGVNSPEQLAALERQWQLQQAQELMQAGVRLADPARLDIRGQLSCGQDVSIDVNCIFEGNVSLGDNVTIGANCIIANATIAANSQIAAFSHIEGSSPSTPNIIGENCKIGPFARLRQQVTLAEEVHIGNFVELKNTSFGIGSKANHLAYLGDASVGSEVNYGAGCITANYDGANKHQTTIEDQVHIGSNSVLVAPVTIGKNGTVAAATVVTEATPPNALSITRTALKFKENWFRPKKKPSNATN